MTKINREELLSALEATAPGLSPRRVVEQSDCFVLRKNRVWAYNTNIACSIPLKAGGVECAVLGEKLISLVRLMQDEELEIEFKDNQLILTGSGHQAGVSADGEITLPVTKIERPDEWHAVPAHFGEALDMVQACATDGKKDDEFITACIHFHPEWVEAFDKRQMLRYSIECGVKEPTLVKRDGVKHAASMGVAAVGVTDNWLHFKGASGLVVSCLRYNETFPDLSGALGVKGEKCRLPKGLAQSIDIADLFSSDDQDSNVVLVEMRAGKVRLTGRGIGGWYKSYKKADYSGPPLAFYIPPYLLKTIIEKYNDAVVNPEKLLVDGGDWSYVACMIDANAEKNEKEAA